MAEQKVLAKRTTYDGKRVMFWNDGAITDGMGNYVRGGKLKTARMLWAIADEISLYDWRELPTILRVSKRVEKRERWTLPQLRTALGKELGPASGIE